MAEIMFKISGISYIAAVIALVISIDLFIRLKRFRDRAEFEDDDSFRMLEDIVIIHTDEYIRSKGGTF